MPSSTRSRRALARGLSGFLALALVAAGAAFVPGRAATPGGGTLGPTTPEVRWSGGPIPAQTAGLSGGGCVLAANDPTCDGFTLTIEDLSAAPTTTTTTRKKPKKGTTQPPSGPVLDDVRIVIDGHVSEGLVAEFDLYVYDASGAEVARSTDLGSRDAVVLEQPAPGDYRVYVQSVLSMDPSATYDAVARVHDSSSDPVDLEPSECGLEGAPPGVVPEDEPTGAGAIVGDPTALNDGLDRGQPISLDVALVLDGVSEADGRALVTKAAESYAPLNIQFQTHSVRTESFLDADNDNVPVVDAMALIRMAKQRMGGVRPEGADLVAVLTSQDIEQLGLKAVAGLADCIGGVAHDDRAFLVAEAYGAENYGLGVPAGPGVLFGVNARANVLAHEAGHLMGGQHHYGNCVEGIATSDVRDDGTIEVSPCTLMFNAADFLGSNFGTVNAAIVRGSAVRYAQQ